jgi:hypothetical protein
MNHACHWLRQCVSTATRLCNVARGCESASYPGSESQRFPRPSNLRRELIRAAEAEIHHALQFGPDRLRATRPRVGHPRLSKSVRQYLAPLGIMDCMSNFVQRLRESSGRSGSRTTAPSSKLKYLRIASSVFCLTICAGMAFLWARSYSTRDVVAWRVYDARMFRVFLIQGQLEFETYANQGAQENYISAMSIEEYDAADSGLFFLKPEPRKSPHWGWERTRTGRFSVYVPHRFIVLLSGVLGVIFAVLPSPRFGLRSLFIATALIAILLGTIIVWR